ncbi:MAG TPA: hypothetical protein GYA06_10740 [Chloroflexi bacterium]|nr:hypothetical protein [Chloroflexota bacterium]
MENEVLGAYTWVARPEDLRRTVADLSHHAVLAVDTESNSLYAYQEQVCLIQFSTDQDDYLIDPLAIHDLSPIGPILGDPAIEKVFHAAEYDLICLKRDFGFQVRNLFDTMVACRILGRENVGLGSLLFEEFGLVIDKRYQRANWGQRPLPPELLSYARLDTHYLVALRDRLEAELKLRGRWELALEDFKRLEKTAVPSNDHTNGSCWKIPGVHELSPRQLAVLLALCEYRDQRARRENLPHFKVLSNEILLQIALVEPDSIDELYDIPHLSRRLVERHGEGLIAAVRRGKTSKPPRRPPAPPRPDDEYLICLDALRSWRKLTGRELGVDSDIVLPRDVMELIAARRPSTLAELEPLMSDLPWRFQRLGREIIAVLNR